MGQEFGGVLPAVLVGSVSGGYRPDVGSSEVIWRSPQAGGPASGGARSPRWTTGVTIGGRTQFLFAWVSPQGESVSITM